jgi:hypothetical protein
MRVVLICAIAFSCFATTCWAGTVITTNLPPYSAIVNVNAKQDGAASWNAGQDSWFQPFFTGGATSLTQLVVQPGTYSFRLTNPTLAAAAFPALTAGQLSEIFTAWTYNSPWITDYFVFDAAGVASASVPDIFAGAIRPAGLTGGTASATEAFNFAVANHYDDIMVKQPGGRNTGIRTTRYTFTSTETLTFAVPDNILSDNNGGVSVLVQLVGDGVPADYNSDGAVDAADYVVWRDGQPLANEVATLGSVTAEDYTAWRARFGNYSGSGSALNPVPEPEIGMLVLVLISFMSLAKCGRASDH